MSQKRTPWFPGHIKPVRPGVYECEWKDALSGRYFNEWTGQNWKWGNDSPITGATVMPPSNYVFLVKWRGLAEPTK